MVNSTEGIPPYSSDGTVTYHFGREEELLDMLAELPDEHQVGALVSRLQGPALRGVTVDVLSYSVRAARDSRLLEPHRFISSLSTWIATAQELAASRGRVRQILKDREELRNPGI